MGRDHFERVERIFYASDDLCVRVGRRAGREATNSDGHMNWIALPMKR